MSNRDLKKANQEKFFEDVSRKKLRPFLYEKNSLGRNIRNRLEDYLKNGNAIRNRLEEYAKKGPITILSKPKILPKRNQSTLKELQPLYSINPSIECDNYWQVLNEKNKKRASALKDKAAIETLDDSDEEDDLAYVFKDDDDDEQDK